MSKKKIVCLVIAAIMLLGVITVNASTASNTGSFYCSNVPSPDYYFLYGNTWFTLSHSDMKKQTGSGYYDRIKVDHNLFACAAGYNGMEVTWENTSAGTNYQHYTILPGNGANYGGNPTYTFVQSAYFLEGSWGMNAEVKLKPKFRGTVGDTWCKDETVTWGYTRQVPACRSINSILDAERR